MNVQGFPSFCNQNENANADWLTNRKPTFPPILTCTTIGKCLLLNRRILYYLGGWVSLQQQTFCATNWSTQHNIHDTDAQQDITSFPSWVHNLTLVLINVLPSMNRPQSWLWTGFNSILNALSTWSMTLMFNRTLLSSHQGASPVTLTQTQWFNDALPPIKLTLTLTVNR